MKTKNIYFFAALSITLFVALVLITGCGKSDKEVKTNTAKEKGSKTVSKTLKIDTAASTMNWVGKKVTGQHNGTIKITKGEVGLDNSNAVVNGNFEVDMKSIVNLDLDDAEWNTKLITHLKSDDFFSVEKFPTSKFEITNVETLNDAAKPNFNSTVTGNLTMKSVTKSITFPASIKFDNGVLSAFADFDIDRTQWDIKYGSGKFFEGLGDKMISDNFNISFKITAK
jgi:polyisoprenoid-binding protein YceI